MGHSTRPAGEFLDLLQEFGIGLLVDVRRFPGSRKFPHFGRQALQESLASRSIEYLWMEELGGRRGRGQPNSPNAGLRVQAFRSYADYMGSGEFRSAISELLTAAAGATAAIMCAESLYWRCHRRLISDYLLACGVSVCHILAAGKVVEHQLTRGAVITRERNVIYPPPLPESPAA